MEKKEAMKILKDFHDKSALFSVRTALDTIIPELRESEDEAIRKAILELVKQSSEILDKQNQNNMINWLEKQGEEKTVNYPLEGMFPYTDPADTLDGEIENIWNKLRNCDNTFTAAKSGFYEVIHHFANWLEKQVKQKSTDKPKFEIGDEIKTDNEDPLTITKIDEQGYWSGDLFICSFEDSAKWELVGKIIKPKFEVGDWITNGDYTWKIIEVKPLDYILQSQDGNIVDDTISHVDEQFHSFTIEDAKDGDVLVNGSNIFIFHFINDTRLMGYCHVNTDDGRFYDDIGKNECFCLIDAVVNPATKEQRDTLFLKMKEAGYEWSEETHELKKISQRMVSAEAKEALYDKPTDKEMKELLRTEYEKGRADTIAEMEKDWSEEDDVMINKLLAVVKLYYDRSGDDLDKQSCISFLKSLKDKVQPQPKQEWSEEDEIARKALINLVEIYYGGCIDKTEKKRLLNLLKSLKPQNRWKPSEEQMNTLNLIISDYYHACTKECDKKAIVLKSILEQLKQL